jgi:hypothetical protein
MPRTLLQAMSHGNIPRVPDAGPQTHEYLCVHYVDGEEWASASRSTSARAM